MKINFKNFKLYLTSKTKYENFNKCSKIRKFLLNKVYSVN